MSARINHGNVLVLAAALSAVSVVGTRGPTLRWDGSGSPASPGQRARKRQAKLARAKWLLAKAADKRARKAAKRAGSLTGGTER